MALTANLQRTLDLACELMAQHGLFLRDWSFKFDRATTRYGQCDFNKRTISMSRHWAEARPENEVRQTILHEIAHALVGPEVAAHGREWKMKAIEIGARPDRCSSSSVEIEIKKPWVGTCPLCSHSIAFQRAPLRVSGCPAHRAWNPRHALVWRKNGKKVPMPARFMAEVARIKIKHGVDVIL